jgi:hypothetical protein
VCKEWNALILKTPIKDKYFILPGRSKIDKKYNENKINGKYILNFNFFKSQLPSGSSLTIKKIFEIFVATSKQPTARQEIINPVRETTNFYFPERFFNRIQLCCLLFLFMPSTFFVIFTSIMYNYISSEIDQMRADYTAAQEKSFLTCKGEYNQFYVRGIPRATFWEQIHNREDDVYDMGRYQTIAACLVAITFISIVLLWMMDCIKWANTFANNKIKDKLSSRNATIAQSYFDELANNFKDILTKYYPDEFKDYDISRPTSSRKKTQ